MSFNGQGPKNTHKKKVFKNVYDGFGCGKDVKLIMFGLGYVSCLSLNLQFITHTHSL